MIAFNDVVQIVRRRIGDTDDPFTFDDTLVAGYITDAVFQVEMDWSRGIQVVATTDPDTSAVSYSFNSELLGSDAQLIAIKTHYLIVLRTKSQADRDNFRMVKGRLTLDNTNQADDHAVTLKLLEQEYKVALRLARNGGTSIQGVRVE